MKFYEYGGKAEAMLKKGSVGKEVWFKCQICGIEWQDYCRSCGYPLEIVGDVGVCHICGLQ